MTHTFAFTKHEPMNAAPPVTSTCWSFHTFILSPFSFMAVPLRTASSAQAVRCQVKDGAGSLDSTMAGVELRQVRGHIFHARMHLLPPTA
jgi:hypothetical protein